MMNEFRWTCTDHPNWIGRTAFSAQKHRWNKHGDVMSGSTKRDPMVMHGTPPDHWGPTWSPPPGGRQKVGDQFPSLKKEVREEPDHHVPSEGVTVKARKKSDAAKVVRRE